LLRRCAMLDTRCESSDNRTKNFFDTGGESHRQRAPENYSGCGTAVYLHACTCAPIASRRSIKPKERTALALTIGLSSIGLLERAYRGMKAKLSATAGARCLRNTSTATRFRRRIVHQRATAMAMDIGGAQRASAVLAGRMRDLATTRSRR
jgi:hypothetical protein